jgi:hypothetical protein
MTISLGSIDPCFSCTDRMEVVDLRSGNLRVYSPEELIRMAWDRGDAGREGAREGAHEAGREEAREGAHDGAGEAKG